MPPSNYPSNRGSIVTYRDDVAISRDERAARFASTNPIRGNNDNRPVGGRTSYPSSFQNTPPVDVGGPGSSHGNIGSHGSGLTRETRRSSGDNLADRNRDGNMERDKRERFVSSSNEDTAAKKRLRKT